MRRELTALERSADALEGQVGTAAPRHMTSRLVSSARQRAEERVRKGDWAGAQPSDLVALWAAFHGHVYGVFPDEDLKPAVFAKACVKAARMLRDSFGGDSAKMAAFIGWTWARERSRKNFDNARRVGWALQFSSSLILDWRVATAGKG